MWRPGAHDCASHTPLTQGAPIASRASEIRGSTLSFEWAGSHISVNCDGRISPGEGVFNLYVYHDSGYDPTEEMEIGSADDPKYLLQ